MIGVCPMNMREKFKTRDSLIFILLIVVFAGASLYLLYAIGWFSNYGKAEAGPLATRASHHLYEDHLQDAMFSNGFRGMRSDHHRR